MTDVNARAIDAAEDVDRAQFAGDVGYYLQLHPRQLPSRYLYDALGSALFDAICRLPWYRITRAENNLLCRHARAIFARVPTVATMVELGSGSGEKLATLVGASSASRGNQPLDVHLIDVSASALAEASRAVGQLDHVDVTGHQTTYESGLVEIRNQPRRAGRTLALFLGSNIGNFDPPAAHAFLRSVRAALVRGDAFLLGADLVKPEPELLLTYDDPLGITAAFNRNLLVRINRELGGNFDLPAFAHRAVWNADESRVEMHLVSGRRQAIHIEGAGLELTMAEGETIWTESSYKYRPDAIVRTLESAGFRRLDQWIDQEAGFALTLVEAI